jgi:anaphase-promoting complex subunit 10
VLDIIKTQNTTNTVRRPPVLPWPDIGQLAKWSVSSFKFGFGPECLQDQDPETFWQSVPPNPFPCGFLPTFYLLFFFACSSDGPQPHFITVEFPRKMAIQVQ